MVKVFEWKCDFLDTCESVGVVLRCGREGRWSRLSSVPHHCALPTGVVAAHRCVYAERNTTTATPSITYKL